MKKNDTNTLLHKIWAKHNFSCYRKKKVETNHFFSFFETQNWCLKKKISFVKKVRIFFIFNFLITFWYHFAKNEKNLKKMKKMIPINCYTKFGQNTTFHILGKKVGKRQIYPFFETQNRCLTKNVSFVKKIRRFFSFIFWITFRRHFG